MNPIKSILLLCFLVLIASSASSQEHHSISSLSFKLGTWKWEAQGLNKPGDSNVYSGEGYSNVFYVNDSTSIIDDHRIFWENGIDYKAITYRTYDPASKKYMVVWAQANSGNTTKIEGHWEGEKFIELETGTDSYGSWTNRLELYDIKPNSHKAKLVRTYESGFRLTILEYSANRIGDQQ
ncbi:MAG: hypothetical protein JJ971_06335 [Balneolaceae bacterium]|nr:hypothetical protein [Balneolaceae bacterium]MBO6545992.1 hypothetical protein [Balneolaceae bacterium]MBO6647388.1 hypothetical protein [Balneolaceae bacterium]